MGDEVYHKLRERLDRTQGPFPATASGVELRILKKLFTPEEAAMALHLSHLPEPPSAIANRAGMDESQVAKVLESMALQGSILRARGGDKVFYFAIPFIVGVYEFHLNSLDRELAEMMEEYMPHLYSKWSGNKTKQVRVIPIEASIPAKLKVEPYHVMRELIMSNDKFAVANCICRKEKGLLGHKCERPHETCLAVGAGAYYSIENKIGREISREEAFQVLKTAEENALVLSPTNGQKIVNICCCCSCCCGVLKALKAQPKPALEIDSPFQAKIDKDLCSGCGECLERCQMEAIKEGDEYEVDLDRCIGCGLCVPTCPTEAVTMVMKPEQVVPPKHYIDTTITIMKERGVLK
jgi:Na+-translocating ferredoxin:NAD+ oxidoreductase subunit B